MKKSIIIPMLIVMGFGIVGFTVYKMMWSKSEKTEAKTIYYCPMHPSYTSSKPGDCPICGMKLVPLKKDYDEHTHKTPSINEASIEGRVSITISPEKQQKIGVRFENIEKKKLIKTIRFTSVVEHDETRYATIAPRFGGWIQKLFGNYIGQELEKGEPLMTVYSPEVLSGTAQYIVALEQFEKIKTNPSNPEYNRAKELVESARKKLSLWELGAQEIQQTEEKRISTGEVLLRSPISGHIINKTALEGRYFTAGETLYEIGDLSNLWVRVYVYEQDYPFIKTGQLAHVFFPYLNKNVDGIISFIYPHINEKTRRAEVRLEIKNQDRFLRPGMWANVEIELNYGVMLLIPASAVIDTGSRYIAFVRLNEQFQPRELKIGLKSDDFYQIIEGIDEGEKVVANPLFLIDSESQIKSAILGITNDKQH